MRLRPYHEIPKVSIDGKNLDENEERHPVSINTFKDRDIKVSSHKMHNNIK